MRNSSFMRYAIPSCMAIGITLAASPAAAQGGIGGNAGPGLPVASGSPSGADAATATLMIGLSGSTDGVLMSLNPFSVVTTIPGMFTDMSGLSWLPGSAIFSMTGGHADNGNLYHLLGSGLLVGPIPTTGYSTISGLSWVNGGSMLVGTGSNGISFVTDRLVYINAFTGACTDNGPLGGAIDGVDSLAQNPLTGTVYMSTGYAYDGSPGDILTVNLATGLGSDTGQDFSPMPNCTVAGMSFDLGGTGYISIGCGAGNGGNVYSWNPSGTAISLLGNGTGFSASMNDIQALF